MSERVWWVITHWDDVGLAVVIAWEVVNVAVKLTPWNFDNDLVDLIRRKYGKKPPPAT